MRKNSQALKPFFSSVISSFSLFLNYIDRNECVADFSLPPAKGLNLIKFGYTVNKDGQIFKLPSFWDSRNELAADYRLKLKGVTTCVMTTPLAEVPSKCGYHIQPNDASQAASYMDSLPDAGGLPNDFNNQYNHFSPAAPDPQSDSNAGEQHENTNNQVHGFAGPIDDSEPPKKYVNLKEIELF